MDLQQLPNRIRTKITVDERGCWVWQGARISNGYGKTFISHRKTALAHRVMYELLVGPIPSGLELDHLCRNRPCVNPTHLEPVTHRENGLRGDAKPPIRPRQTYCIRGHELAVSARIGLDGERHCRPCDAIRQAAYKARQKVATP